MNWYKRLGLTPKLVVPFVAIIMLVIICELIYIRSTARENVIQSASDHAVATIDQYKLLRSYYTKNIVKKVKQHGQLKLHYDHKGVDATLPLPATVIHDLSKQLETSKSGIKLRLYSSLPFPNRKDRALDEFQKEAVDHLVDEPTDVFIKRYLEGDNPTVRVAIADRLVAKGCVNCHNNHPQTPYRNWKLGDVRGILEVQTPIKKEILAGNSLAANVGWTITFSGIIILCLMTFILSKFIVKPVKNLTFKLRSNSTGSESGEALIQSSQEILSATREEADQIQTTVSALDEIEAMVAKSLESAKLTDAKSQKNSEIAKKGRTTVSQMDSSMEKIKSRTEEMVKEIQVGNDQLKEIVSVIDQIADKTQVINDIVFQTKLLSFNASVEAARAGEHGKGFAVVAEEVGNLAQMSGKASSEISALIAESTEQVDRVISDINKVVKDATVSTQQEVTQGISIVKDCESVFSQIAENVLETDQLIDEIVHAAKEQKEGVSNISGAVKKIDASATRTSDISKTTLEYAKNLSVQAKSLQEVVSALEVQVLGSGSSAKAEPSDTDLNNNGDNVVDIRRAS